MAGAAGDRSARKLIDQPSYNRSQDSFTCTDDGVVLDTDNSNRLVAMAKRLWLRMFPLGFRDEFLVMFALSWPAILTTFFQFFLQTTSIIMCGQLGKIDLDSVALANSFINVAGICIGVGMSTACDTLFSQTFGSRNKKRMGMYLQRGLMVMYSVLVLLWCLHLNIKPVLLWLGQNSVIADKTARYMLYFMPGLFFDYSFLVLSRFLQNQNIMYPPMIAGFVGNIFNVVSQYLAIHIFDYGYLSSAVLQASSLAVMFFLTLIYTLCTGVYKDCWDGWKVESLYKWWDFVKLAVPGIFLIALEEWSFEISTIVAGTLGEVQLGAQSIVFQMEAISYMIPFGISVAVNIRVGQQLGGNQPLGAAQSFRIGLLMMSVTALLMLTIFASLRNYLPFIFSSDEEIVHVASNVLPILGAFQIADGVTATSSGAIRGCGRQIQGAVVLFVGFYIIGLPMGISLALATDLQVLGMWIGLLVGYSIEAVAFCCLVLRLNWRLEAHNAQLRAYGEDAAEAEIVDADQSIGNNNSSSVVAGGNATGDSSNHWQDSASYLPSDAESECSPLVSNSFHNEIAFYSDPESSSASAMRYRRRQAARRKNSRRRHTEQIYTGRFYSRSFSVHFGDSSDEDEDETESEVDSESGDAFKSVLVKRLLTLAFLMAAFAGSVLLRLFSQHDDSLGLLTTPVANCTAVTAGAASSSGFATFSTAAAL
ncbi:hypothetical protein BOX15_Mlig004257g1 [Macrostomum lignano]|uniref:Multidrug and toxin extrusion protein n=1 Tax=Macrostomum lignano TaxID=282301 RepID=A0A267GNU6_9PLAT|nr:hypothetical protein BOX15_Mlig004257g1 [Macrostomum lignano]